MAGVDHPEVGTTRRETAPVASVTSTSDPVTLPGDARRPPAATSEWWQKFDVLSKAALAFATLLLTATATWLTLDTNRKIAERQVLSQRAAQELQRDLLAAQTVLDLLPALIDDADTRRTVIQEILAGLAPKHLKVIADVQRLRARSPDQQAHAGRVLALAIDAHRQAEFLKHRIDGGKYLDLGLDAQAAREYLRAADRLPPHLTSALSESLSHARALYDRRDFSSAARELARAFEAALRHPSGQENQR